MNKWGKIVLCFLLLAVITMSGCASLNGQQPSLSLQAENEYMQIAINEAFDGITHQHGGPFGSVIVKDGKIISKGHNKVLINNDPTSHGEISAIREAGQVLGSFDLSGCVLYTTGEPCTMCLCACLWANIDKVYFGCTIEDSENIGFRDEQFADLFGDYDALEGYMKCIDREACLELFSVYSNMDHEVY